MTNAIAEPPTLTTDAETSESAGDSELPSGPAAYIDKLCFVMCCDAGFVPGARGTIRSIRKQYDPSNADIVIFIEQEDALFERFCRRMSVNLQYTGSIAAWALPLVYDQPVHRQDTRHFYHPDFSPVPSLPHHTDRQPGFDKIRHLHPINVKAYCTGYAICLLRYKQVVHIDVDAFLLGRLDSLFETYTAQDTVIGFDDGEDDLERLEAFYDVARPEDFDRKLYSFNAGLVLYNNGPNVERLVNDFMFYIESCYHFTLHGWGRDQSMLRTLVAKYDICGSINYHLVDGTNWNPTYNRAHHLRMDSSKTYWINECNDRPQIGWHGAGLGRLWSGSYPSSSVKNAWKWAGGDFDVAWWDVHGALPKERCDYVINLVGGVFENLPQRTIDVLEIGTQFGRTSIAFASGLRAQGFDVHIDTCDIYAPSPDYPTGFTTLAEVRANIAAADLDYVIDPHIVGVNESLVKKFSDKKFDFIYIDACHEYKQVLADCVVAQLLCKPTGIIVGDDMNLSSVQEAVYAVFPHEVVKVEMHQWSVEIRKLVQLE